jgi:amino acid transporter
VIAAGFSRFDPKLVADVPPGAWKPSLNLGLGVGVALGIAMYDFLGYYQICYLGDEVTDPEKTIPRSILISAVVISAVYLAMTVAILGVIPWQEVVASPHIATDLIGALSGARAAQVVTLMIVWCAAAGTYAILLGYSRIPYAAARAGHFFRGLAKTHPTGDFPHRSLVLVGALSAVACLGDIATLIAALLIARIPVQFLGQIATVAYLRTRPDLRAAMPFRMPLYPLPALIALVGWLYIIATTPSHVVAYGLASLLLGMAVFASWDRAVESSIAD